jgi:SAM-dependent methyltransferase
MNSTAEVRQLSPRSMDKAVRFDSPIQRIVPSPRRLLQQLIVKLDLKTGLDVGCSDNSPLTPLRELGFHSTGLDAHSDSLEAARRLNLHDRYICSDVREISDGEHFDVVVASHIIEHLPRDDGAAFLAKIEHLATRLVYVETPLGFLEQPAHDGNPFQRHLSGWFPFDFEGRGYSVFGQGVGLGRRGRAPKWMPQVMVRNTERLVQWFAFRHPWHAHAIAGIRYMDPDGNLRSL